MAAATPKGRPRGGAPDRVRQDILAVARREFVANGLSGANINAIAERTKTSKRMIYYYFVSKEGLYCAVLADTYRRIRTFELGLQLERLTPVDALAKLTGATFDYHADDPEHVRLVMVENIHNAKHLKQLGELGAINLPALATIRTLYERGTSDGVFRPGLDPIDIHLTINGLSFFNVSNQASIAEVFQHDMSAPAARARRRAGVIETVMRFVLAELSSHSAAHRQEVPIGVRKRRNWTCS